MQRGGGSGKQRKRRDNLKRKITLARRPDTWFKGKPQVASIEFRRSTWKQSRYVIKRTPVIARHNWRTMDCASTPTTSW